MDPNQTPTPPINQVPTPETDNQNIPPIHVSDINNAPNLVQPNPQVSQSGQSQFTHGTPANYPIPPQNIPKSSKIPTILFATSILIVIAIVVISLIAHHISNSHIKNVATKSQSQLQPTLPGETQCGVGAEYAQVAISGGANCTTANVVAQAAKGSNYSSNGYSCISTKQGNNTKWSSFWTGTFYSYTCSDGSKQIAFNWQLTTATNSSSNSNSSSSTQTVTIGGPGALQPTLPGGGECNAGSNYAQIAISSGASCTIAESVIQSANGSNFSSNGYTCSGTKEGSNTQWSSYWKDNLVAYTCSSGNNQIAFTWQGPTASQ
jgi:hypothetical protein